MKQSAIDRFEEIMNILEEDVDFIQIRKRVQKAVDASPNNVTYAEALKQVNSYERPSKKLKFQKINLVYLQSIRKVE